MNSIKYLLVLLLLVVISGNLFAQNLELDGILEAKLKNMDAIKDGKDVTGYFMFYEVDKKDRKTRNYVLQFLDQNLNTLKTERITGLDLVAVEYNGETIMLQFIDNKEREIIFKQYGNNSELLYTTQRDASLFELYTLRNQQQGTLGVSSPAHLYPIKNEGFINILPKNTGRTYAIEFLPSNTKSKGWTYESSPKSKSKSKSKEIATASHLGYSEDVYLANVEKRPRQTSMDLKTYVLGIDNKTGKKLYELDLSDKTHDLLITNSYFDKNTANAIMLGQYYDVKDNSLMDYSKGLCLVVVNKSGEISSKKLLSWTEDIAKHLDLGSKKGNKKKTSVFFHDFFIQDGKTFIIAEQFSSDFTIQDLLIFEFDATLDLEKIDSIEKPETSFSRVPLGPQIIGHYLNALGEFSYEFTQIHEQEDAFTIVYSDNSQKESDWKLTALTKIDAAYEEDTISLKSSADEKMLLPAKDGYILVMEYFEKQKKLNGRLEKIDY